ncbi:hypothetical protein VISI1226_11881 [Vibrio sinaloensis DSM 21326]|uniref:Uncharacterized protein n=1 Tax=Vibrio sinaloensis DSM 21326 TaxID=945550 RepID=E8M3H5_PHOS4|nr:hypothetical protein VISI1226_11881 [Vibrio sinaloensis DSM 21326]
MGGKIIFPFVITIAMTSMLVSIPLGLAVAIGTSRYLILEWSVWPIVANVFSITAGAATATQLGKFAKRLFDDLPRGR